MRHPEQALQRAVAHYLNLALPDDAWFTAFPAGGGGRVRGAILKGMGLKAGVPDILIVWRGRAYWLELKAPGGRLNMAQGVTFHRLWRCDSPAVVARNLDDVWQALTEWGIPSRARP